MTVFVTALMLLALFPASLSFCGGNPESGKETGRVPTETEKQSDRLAQTVDPELIDANTRFTFSLFQRLVLEDRGKNVFVSPLSILLALAMTYNGAEGDTGVDMAEVLQFSGFALEQLNQGFYDLMASVTNADERVETSIANSIWYRPGYDVQKGFIERTGRYYGAAVRELDFSDPESTDMINRWIDEATKGKIDKMLDRISADTVMYLINAIYFKGDWTRQFSEAATGEGEFFLEAGGRKKVPMMHAADRFQHARGDDFGFLRLPYGLEKIAMYILLPDEGTVLEGIIAQLDAEAWNRLKSDLAEKQVNLAMPKYRLEYKKSLKDVLSTMGMETAFVPGADFSGINPAIFVSEIDHKAVIEVNEKGSEAAGVTVVEMVKSAPPERIEFILNRPFIFAIADDRTGSILFIGKVAEP